MATPLYFLRGLVCCLALAGLIALLTAHSVAGHISRSFRSLDARFTYALGIEGCR